MKKFPQTQMINVGVIDLGCVWDYDFVNKKYDFKSNRKKCIVWELSC